MRLFTGLSVPAQIAEPIGALIESLREGVDFRWSPVENLHITTKFIGEWPEDRLGELENALARVPRPGSFEVSLARFGYLPNPHHPKVFFLGVRGGEALRQLAADTDRALAGLGREPENRDYTPHLTLARISASVTALREKIAKIPAPEFGSYRATEFHLYRSHERMYSKIATYSFEKETA